MEIIKARTGAFMVHIPYRGGAPVMNDLMGGQLDAAVIAVPALLGPLKARRIKVLGIASPARSALLKDTPTTAESQTLRGLTMEVWSMVYARAGTPDAIASRLNAAIARAVSTDGFRSRLARLGAYLPTAQSLAGARDFVAQQQALYRLAAQRIRGS
jgi:tripartite-type tricarboxylate transporter receptor subunit TctC